MCHPHDVVIVLIHFHFALFIFFSILHFTLLTFCFDPMWSSSSSLNLLCTPANEEQSDTMSTQHLSHTCQTQKKSFSLKFKVCCRICFLFVHPPVLAWCDVDGLRSRFPKGGRRSSVAAVHRQSSGLQQIVAAKTLRSPTRQPPRQRVHHGQTLSPRAPQSRRLAVSKQPSK